MSVLLGFAALPLSALLLPAMHGAAMRYMLSISCVDGETDYTMSGFDKAAILTFLADHDHEGSSVYLQLQREGCPIEEHFDGEAIYKILTRGGIF